MYIATFTFEPETETFLSCYMICTHDLANFYVELEAKE